jgi:uncharacterized protein (DUF952 family)
MGDILHITSRDAWNAARRAGVYRGDTLDGEGFIHCSTPAQAVRTADRYFAGRRGLVLLCIDPALVAAEVRYEGAAGEELFPHIYGPLDLTAVIRVDLFEPDEQGSFRVPAGITKVG